MYNLENKEIELCDVDVSYDRDSFDLEITVKTHVKSVLAEGENVPGGKIARHYDDYGMTKWRYGEGQWMSSAYDAIQSHYESIVLALNEPEQDDLDVYKIGLRHSC